jgi:hypothetical protein
LEIYEDKQKAMMLGTLIYCLTAIVERISWLKYRCPSQAAPFNKICKVCIFRAAPVLSAIMITNQR